MEGAARVAIRGAVRVTPDRVLHRRRPGKTCGAVPSRYDVFISHAGKSKVFAQSVAELLGGDQGFANLGLRAFVDKQALKPGDDADRVMMEALDRAPVGMVLLDKHFLKKSYPVAELRQIVRLGRELPVLYKVTYEGITKLMAQLSTRDPSAGKGASSTDTEMLSHLKRITMACQKLEDPVAYKERLCFDTLRRLVEACSQYERFAVPSDVMFVLRVRNAVQLVCNQELLISGGELDANDLSEATDWLIDVTSQLCRMERQVYAIRNFRLKDSAKCKMEACQLERLFSEPAVEQHLECISEVRQQLGEDWPQGLLSMPNGASSPVWNAAQELAVFWKTVERKYRNDELLQPGEDADCLEGFFTKQWTERGRVYRELVEPVDIANWYRHRMHVEWGHYADDMEECELDALALNDNRRRPTRYILLQSMEMRSPHTQHVQSSLTASFELKRMPWLYGE